MEGKPNPFKGAAGLCLWGCSGVSKEKSSSRWSKSKLVEVSARAGKEEFLVTSARFSSPRSKELLDKSSLTELEAELELAVGREEMLASMFTMLELSSMLLERLEFPVRFPKTEKLVRLLLEVLPREKLARLLELVARLGRLESLAKWKLLLPIPSKIAKLAAVPHFGWEEELASRSVTLDRFPMLKVKVESLTHFQCKQTKSDLLKLCILV